MNTYTLKEYQGKFGGTPVGMWCWGEAISQCDCQMYTGDTWGEEMGFYENCDVCEGHGVPPIPLEELM